MFIYKRFAILFSVATTLLLVFLIYRSSNEIKSSQIWKGMPQRVGLGDYFDTPDDEYDIEREALRQSTLNITSAIDTEHTDINDHDIYNLPSRFKPGTPKPPGSTYSKAVIMPKVKAENISWLEHAHLPPEVELFVYGMDDPEAKLRPPLNKGHEGMAYLTYIIDHYDQLRDVSIFMHPHRTAWHNNELLNHDALEMITRLSAERVVREGYMSMRCHWNPGCPEWIHPGHVSSDKDRPEESEMAEAWAILFPGQPIPSAIGTACCAQFAVSRERIRSVPVARFKHYREWLLRTRIRDSISGRVFEYLWAKFFTDQAVFCPDQRVCYCDGFGVCFEDEKSFDYVFELKYQRDNLQAEYDDWLEKASALSVARKSGLDIESMELAIPSVDDDGRLRTDLNKLVQEIEQIRRDALQLGTDPQVRARIAGRPWKEGDGF